VVAHLRALSERQHHPWGRASVKRCSAIIALAHDRESRDAAAGLQEAADEYGQLGLRFDQARTLLALGRVQRRRRKWAGARDALERAAAEFNAMGSARWAELAGSELKR